MTKKTERFIATQLFSFEPFKDQVNGFEEKMKLAKTKLHLKALMIGANLKENELHHVMDICDRLDIEKYLWFPLLADIPQGVDISSLMLEGLGEETESFILNQQKESGEDFGFLCPVKAYDSHELYNFYERYLEKYSFEGVFLDKIRYPSPANGLANLIGCQCPSCRKLYAEHNLNPVELFDDLFNQIRQVASSEELVQVVKEKSQELKAFYAFREQNVKRLVSKYINGARKRQMKVGIDLFTLSLASVVSQNYHELSNMADWVKPMLYLKTMGPAGLPMEFSSLVKIIKGINTGLAESDIIHFLSEILSIQLPQTLKEIENEGLRFEVFSDEVKKAETWINNQNINIYPGFEAVKFPPICDMSEEGLKAYLKQVKRNDLNGFVLSWDISKIPKKYIEQINL